MRRDYDCGSYRSADEYVGQAVSLLFAHHTWITEHRAEIRPTVADRFVSAKRPDAIEPV